MSAMINASPTHIVGRENHQQQVAVVAVVVMKTFISP